MPALLMAMASILLTWLAVGAAIIGIGMLVRRFIRASREVDAGEILLSFWLGFAGVILILQTCNFFAPVNAAAAIGVLALGAIGLAIERRSLATWIPRTLREQRGTIALFTLAAIWLSNRCIGPGNADDSGLYHYSAILWARSFPVVPGVGNLAAPLAMNNATFLYAAMLDQGPWQGRTEHVSNGLLLLALWAQVILGCRLLVQRRGWLIENIFNAIMLVPACMLAIAKDVSSPKTDLPAGVISIVIGWRLLRLLMHPDARERNADRLLALAAICAAAVCVKLSTIAIAGVAGVIALLAWLSAVRAARQPIVAPIAACVLIVGSLLGTWMGRNVIMSGYPLFPSGALKANVEWRVQESAMQFFADQLHTGNTGGITLWMHNIVKSNRALAWYAPLIDPPFDEKEGVSGLNWLRPWLFALPLTSPVEIVIPLVLAACAMLWLLKRGPPRRVVLLVALPAIAGLTLWFMVGHDARYGWPAAWMLAAIAIATAFACDRESLTGRSRKAFAVLIASLLIPVFTYRLAVQVFLGRSRPLTEVVLYGPGPDRGFHPRPSVPMTTVTNRHGLTIHVPTGDYPVHCWNGPLPCSGWPPLDPDLRLRVDGDLAGGFVIDRSE